MKRLLILILVVSIVLVTFGCRRREEPREEKIEITVKREDTELKKKVAVLEKAAEELKLAKGEIIGSKYINKKYRCQVQSPQGWKMDLPETQFLFQVDMISPDKSAVVLLAAVRVGRMTAKAVVLADEAVTKKMFTDYKLLSEREIIRDNLEGYESISEFAIGDSWRRRRRTYFVDGEYVYFFVFDAFPPERYKRWEKDFNEITKSFKLE